MKLQEFLSRSSDLVNELSEAIEKGQIGLKEVEERILQFANHVWVEEAAQEASAGRLCLIIYPHEMAFTTLIRALM